MFLNFVGDFFKNLDTLNLFLFLGIVIVIILLLAFSILMANKNKKLKRLLELKERKVDNKSIDKNEDFIPIDRSFSRDENNKYPLQTEERELKENNHQELHYTNNSSSYSQSDYSTEQEKNNNDARTLNTNNDPFIAEEYVQQEHITNNNLNKENTLSYPINKPYQKNVLREMSLNQTSPIGIGNSHTSINNKIDEYQELNKSLNDNINEDEDIKRYHEEKKKSISENQSSDIMTSDEKNSKIEQREIDNKAKIEEDRFAYWRQNLKPKFTDEAEEKDRHGKKEYLEEVSKKLSNAVENNNIDRTAYELQQEEDAIISYEELMQKKDQIRIIDEEDAVISIEELISRKQNEDKVYQLSNSESNDKFIDELKNFRGNLN